MKMTPVIQEKMTTDRGSVLQAALAVEGLLIHMIGYLPWRKQVDCRRISKSWRAAAALTPVKNLHVEDYTKQIWRFPVHLQRISQTNNEEADDDCQMPLYLVARIPASFAAKVITMTIVMRFSYESQHNYDWKDFPLDRKSFLQPSFFDNLEELTICSEFSLVTELQLFPKSLPNLKRLLFYETEIEVHHSSENNYMVVDHDWQDDDNDENNSTTNSTHHTSRVIQLRQIVETAPRLEYLECPSHINLTGQLEDLLPLASTLKVLNVHQCPAIRGHCWESVRSFLPRLQAWNIDETRSSSSSSFPSKNRHVPSSSSSSSFQLAEDLPSLSMTGRYSEEEDRQSAQAQAHAKEWYEHDRVGFAYCLERMTIRAIGIEAYRELQRSRGIPEELPYFQHFEKKEPYTSST